MRESIRLVIDRSLMTEKVEVLKFFEHAKYIVFIPEVFGVDTDCWR